jgi:hypothetical protein
MPSKAKQALPGTRNPHWLRDRLIFEWPWLRAAILLPAIVTLAIPNWPSALQWAAISALNSVLCMVAIGFRFPRKSARVAIAIIGASAAAGALIPAVLLQIIWQAIAGLLILLAVGLRCFYPYCGRLVRKGDRYFIGEAAYEMPDIAFKTPRIFYLRPELLEEVAELAEYADRFLDRHGIQYVACYGTLLGALRHGGPMPWDDDVDFTIYRPVDLQRVEQSLPELAADASRDGYCLFAHNDYWKLSKKGFWRYPVVDLYRAAIHQPTDAKPQRISWGSITLCIPDDAEKYIINYYGSGSLKEAVFDIPFWDSGFVPAAVKRLLGTRLSNVAGDLYDALFK